MCEPPRKGYDWLVLFERPMHDPSSSSAGGATEPSDGGGGGAADDGDAAAAAASGSGEPSVAQLGASTPRARAFVECRAAYRENLIALLTATHERFEPDALDVPHEFDSAYINALLERLSAVADEVAEAAGTVKALLLWHSPTRTVASWAYVMALTFFLVDDSHLFALPAALALTLMLATAAPRVSGRYQVWRISFLGGGRSRQCDVCRIHVRRVASEAHH